MSVEALVRRVRRALGVSASYDSEDIPDLIRSAVGRMLRDYNFPKSITRVEFTLVLNDQDFDLPAGFKKDLQVRFYDPTDDTWSDPLQKAEAFRMPAASGNTEFYWIEGTKLYIDTAIESDGVGTKLILFYQNMSVSVNEDWLTEDFADAVCYLAIMRGAVDFRKPSVAKDYAALWTDEQTSLAIYLNELEWGNVVMMQRERRIPPTSRYSSDAE